MTVTSESSRAIAELENGRDLLDRERDEDALRHFKKATALDPDFALAHAYVGELASGNEGTVALEKAVVLAASLPEAERTVIQAMHLNATGEVPAAMAAFEKAATLAPGDFHVRDAWQRSRTTSVSFEARRCRGSIRRTP